MYDDVDSEIGEERWVTSVNVELEYTSLKAAAQPIHDRIIEAVKREVVDGMLRQMFESVIAVEVRIHPNSGPLWNGVVKKS